MSKPSLDASSDSSSSDPLLVRHGAGSSDTDEDEAVITTPPSCHKRLASKRTLFALLSWYSKFCGSSSNQDKLLKVIQWTLTLLTSRPWPQKVALEISFARYVTRLLHLPVALEAAAHDSWVAKAKQQSTQQWYQWIGRILAYSMVLYYPTEHMAYVLWMQPAAAANDAVCKTNNSRYPWIPTWKAEKWSYWSCRCWCAYIVAELAQNLLQLRELAAADDDEDDDEREKTASAVTDTQLQLARNALFLLPAIHWSLPSWDTQPWLRGRTVTWLMWAEAVVSFYQGYRKSG